MARIAEAYVVIFLVGCVMVRDANCRIDDIECPSVDDDIGSVHSVVEECLPSESCVRFCRIAPCEAFNLTLNERAVNIRSDYKILIGMKCESYHKSEDDWKFSEVR